MNLQRKTANIAGSILEKARYLRKNDPYDAFNKLRSGEQFPKENQGNVLILPIRMAPVSNLLEGVYGYAMRLRGYSVHALFCRQAIEKCENIDSTTDSVLNCVLCHYEQKRFANTFAIEGHSYSDLLNESIIHKISDIAFQTALNEIFTLKYDDVLLGHHIKSAILRYLLSSDVDVIKHEKLVRQFTYSTLISFESTKQLLLKLKPKFVLSSHGVYSTWGGALEACKLMGIPTVVWGRGYIRGNFVASRNESYLYERVHEPTEYWENIELSDIQKEKLNNYFIQKKNPNSSIDYVKYYKGIKTLKKSLFELLNLDNSRTRFGLFPNIPWDGTTFSASDAFPDMTLFMKTTIDWFQNNPLCDLIIRAHPAEKLNKTQETIKDVIDSITLNLPNNIYFLEADHPVSSYEVEKICDYSLMYASTMSLEFAYFGGTVIQAGQCNTSNKGFVFEAKNVKDYKDLLNKASRKELFMSDDMKDKVKKYAYHWIYKRHIPETTYEHKNLTFVKYNLKDSMDLAYGKNKVIDWFIDRCIDGKPFIWDVDA